MRRLHNIGRLFTGTQVGVIEKAAVICDDDERGAGARAMSRATSSAMSRTTKTAAAGS
jgi:hypothetical protein